MSVVTTELISTWRTLSSSPECRCHNHCMQKLSFCIYCWSEIGFSWITPAILTDQCEILRSDRDSDGTLPWKLWATSVNGNQNCPGNPELFCQGDNASEMPFLSGRFAWNLETRRESMWSSTLLEKIAIFSTSGVIHPQNRLFEPCFSGCFVVAYTENAENLFSSALFTVSNIITCRPDL